MNRRQRRWSLAAGAAIVLVILFVVLWQLRTDRTVEFWSGDAVFPIRVIHGEQINDIELTDCPGVVGHVAYEGPTMVEGQPNWKAGHDYRGVSLRELLDRTGELGSAETVTLVALDGWYKTLPYHVVDGKTVAGTPLLALTVDEQMLGTWNNAPMLVFLPEDERFSNEDMVGALGEDYSHYFGENLSTTGLMVKGVAFVVIDYDGGELPTLSDL